MKDGLKIIWNVLNILNWTISEFLTLILGLKAGFSVQAIVLYRFRHCAISGPSFDFTFTIGPELDNKLLDPVCIICICKCSYSAVAPIFSGVWTSELLRNSSYAQKRWLGPLYLSIYESHLFAKGVILCYWMLYQFHRSCCSGLGNYWQRPRHLRCSYQHSSMIMMSSVLKLRRHYCTERK